MLLVEVRLDFVLAIFEPLSVNSAAALPNQLGLRKRILQKHCVPVQGKFEIRSNRCRQISDLQCPNFKFWSFRVSITEQRFNSCEIPNEHTLHPSRFESRASTEQSYDSRSD